MAHPSTPRREIWIGRAASAIVAATLFVDGAVQLFAPATIAGMMREAGFAMALTPILGWIMVACAILYAIPATSVLGAIVSTGFLGGAICSHVRLGEVGSPPEIISLLLGMTIWGGLYLRDARICALMPLRH